MKQWLSFRTEEVFILMTITVRRRLYRGAQSKSLTARFLYWFGDSGVWANHWQSDMKVAIRTWTFIDVVKGNKYKLKYLCSASPSSSSSSSSVTLSTGGRCRFSCSPDYSTFPPVPARSSSSCGQRSSSQRSSCPAGETREAAHLHPGTRDLRHTHTHTHQHSKRCQ